MNKEYTSEIIDIFWKHIIKTESCWIWTGTIRRGSPDFKWRDSEYFPRHISLYLDGQYIKGNIYPSCKNKLCVNPDHLMNGDESRFWGKVQKLSEENGGCWVWIAGQDKDMYGKFKIKGLDIRAHVYSWALFTGRPVPKGLQVCHKCDHPYCVNPDHLFLGTTQCNTQDRDLKGRQSKGEKHPCAKLTIENVKHIRQLYRTNWYSQSKLAAMFEVSVSVIGAVVRRETWRHIT